MPDRELRYLQTTELRALGGSGDADPLRLEGYAAVFNRSAKLPKFEERIKPGAFTRSIQNNADVVCLWNHNSDIVLGRTTAGTLRLNQDSRGLHYVVDLPNTQSARDYHESVRRGDVNGCSFGFMVDKDGQEWSEGRSDDGSYCVLRTLTDFARLTDVSPVTFPCYDGTQLSARAEEPPAELRSAVDAKNLAAIVPPAIEKRPYSKVSEVPDSVPADKKKQWMEVWNSVYDRAVKDGKSAKDAESSAFAQANGVVKESKSMSSDKFEFRAVTGIDGYDIKPQDCPASWSDEVKTAYCTGYNEAMAKAIANKKHGNVAIAIAVSGGMMGIHEMLALPAESGTDQPPALIVDTDLDGDGDIGAGDARAKKMVSEHRDDSIEDFLADLNGALAAKYPRPAEGSANPSCGSLYWICETFETYVIVSQSGPGECQYFAISYTIGDDGETIIFGDMVPVEKTWVPSARCAKRLAEFRDMNEDDDDEGDGDLDDLLDEEFGMQYKGRTHTDTGFHASHTDDGDCAEGDCSCQNRFCPTGSGMRCELPAGVEYRFDVDFKFESRSGMTRTKRVAGKDLSASSFAYVGDPDKTETWKFPIFDASHVRNALARWGQDKGIPAGSKAGVYAKIKAAAKKFGVQVSEPNADAARTETQAEKELRLRFADHMARAGLDFDVRYSPDQARDDHGRFSEGGGDTKQGETASDAASHKAAAEAHWKVAKATAETDKNGKYNFKSEKSAAHARAAAEHENAAGYHSGSIKAGATATGGQKGTADRATQSAQELSKIANKL